MVQQVVWAVGASDEKRCYSSAVAKECWVIQKYSMMQGIQKRRRKSHALIMPHPVDLLGESRSCVAVAIKECGAVVICSVANRTVLQRHYHTSAQLKKVTSKGASIEIAGAPKSVAPLW